jgi:hypothetical protein
MAYEDTNQQVRMVFDSSLQGVQCRLQPDGGAGHSRLRAPVFIISIDRKGPTPPGTGQRGALWPQGERRHEHRPPGHDASFVPCEAGAMRLPDQSRFIPTSTAAQLDKAASRPGPCGAAPGCPPAGRSTPSPVREWQIVTVASGASSNAIGLPTISLAMMALAMTMGRSRKSR